jgi:DNA-binding NarL/FixJ family response regulator
MTKGGKSKIIIADDHPIFRAGINTALKGLPFISKVAEAANGEEVIKLLASEHFDVVLMDIKMEPMNGIRTTEVIRKRFPETKVIALSMHNEEEYILEIFEMGASGYLIKNADKEEIEMAIKEVMNGEKYFSREVSNTLLEHLHRLKGISNEPPEYDAIQKERIRDITFLICHEFSNQEIADTIFLSPRTIEGYRRQIFKATKTNNLVGLIKFSLENKILEDENLKKKFAKEIAKKKY